MYLHAISLVLVHPVKAWKVLLNSLVVVPNQECNVYFKQTSSTFFYYDNINKIWLLRGGDQIRLCRKIARSREILGHFSLFSRTRTNNNNQSIDYWLIVFSIDCIWSNCISPSAVFSLLIVLSDFLLRVIQTLSHRAGTYHRTYIYIWREIFFKNLIIISDFIDTDYLRQFQLNLNA